MNPASAIAKGKLLEDYVAQQIREKGIDLKAYRSHGSGNGNTEKGDIWTSMMILGQNAGIECKNHSTLHIPEWWKQVKKLESLGREPVLVFKQFGESLEESKCIVYLDTLLELIKASNTSPKAPESLQTNEYIKYDKELIYALSTLKNSILRVNKLLENGEH